MHETSRLGLELFIEAIRQTPLSLGVDNFDWVVTYNGSDYFARTIITSLKLAPIEIQLVRQKKSDSPVPIKPLLGMWKVAPPRLRQDVPEIICDNDFIFVKRFTKIDKFVETNVPLLVQDPIRFYGNLDHLHPSGENWNSGLLTLPANYDFGKNIYKEWKSLGSPNLNYAEEQSLLTKIIKGMDPVIINTDEIVELNKDGIPNRPGTSYFVTGKEYGFHFVESNRHHHREAINFINRMNPGPPILI